jgi:hypothetical protein
MAKLALYFATALAVVAIVLIGMMIISLKADPRYYKASAMVFVSAPQGRMIDASVWRACRRAAESDAVAQEAIERLDVSTTPEDLLGRTDGEWVENTQFFKVSYIDANPQRAQRGLGKPPKRPKRFRVASGADPQRARGDSPALDPLGRLPRRHSELCPECGSPALIFVHWPPAET